MAIIGNVSENKRRRIWDELREYKDVRIRVSDIFPAPLIGRWSVGLGGLLTKLIGDDPSA